MSDQQENAISFPTTIDLHDKTTQQKFDHWMERSKLIQIRYVSALTGLLYIVYSQLDSLVAPSEALALMTTIHLYILPPILFLISLLTFKKDLYKLSIFLVIIAPIVAVVGNLTIVANLENPAVYMTEIYLIIFWIFTVSGLRLWQATISAFSTFIVVFVVSYFLFSLAKENFIMHCFWMLASLSFGFLGAYLLEKSYKTVFINHEHLKQLAITDKLTGLYNRAKLDKVLQDELDRSERFDNKFGLVIMDLDRFKNINDTYGHQVGDDVLVEISKLITEHLRSTDKAIRWGGEEFMLIYLEVNREEVLKLTEDLRLKIEQHLFAIVGQQTASLGVTLYKDGDTIDSIIQRADKALYSAKSGGRNRIEFL
ncbi:MAG: GGDEF domain-containing protein [Sulfurimonadaceae bacterium]